MTATNHALTGATIALAVKRPELAIPLAFLSHFALDAIPHFGVPPGKFVLRKYYKFLVGDFVALLAMTVVLAVLFTSKFWIILSCMAVAAGPDFMWWIYRKNLEDNNKQGVDVISRFHWWIQWKEFTKGIFIEVGWFIIMCTIILIIKY